MQQLAAISLMHGWLPTGLFSLTASALILLVITKSQRITFGKRRSTFILPLLMQLGIAVIFFLLGGLLVWLISDVFLVFGVSLGGLVMLSVAFGFAGLGFCIACAVMATKGKRILALVTIVLVLLSTALRVDMVYGEYTTLGSIFGISGIPTLKPMHHKSNTMTIAQWHRLANQKKLPTLAQKGHVRSVDIPPTQSKFKARTAIVYLPPAALVKHPPQLPVMVMFAGQPGSPSRFFNASDIANTLDAYANKHHGLAPIVVTPDQNGATTQNSLCTDTPVYGNAGTYLTNDVPHWIRNNLPVSTDPRMWMIGGFSQGGTCATQIAPAHPELFRHIFSAGGEIAPTYNNEQQTIQRYFHGDVQAYKHHVPAEIMRKHAPLAQYYYAVAGAWDPKSQQVQRSIAQVAHQAGISVITMLAPTSGHDWHTVQAGLQVAIDQFAYHTGITMHVPPLSSYAQVRILTNKQWERK